MERLLNRLERRFGRYAFENVTWYLVGIQAFVFVLAYVKPEVLGMLELDSHKVMEGQVYRLVTWLFIPISLSPIWALFAFYWLYLMGSALEAQWGAFRYQVYWGVGALGTVIAGFALETPISNVYLVMSLFLAFATLWPDYEILVFFILPVKVKWLSILDAAALLVWMAGLHGWERIVPAIAIGNYLLFFYRPLIEMIGRKSHEGRRAKAWNRFKVSAAEGVRERKCAVCGLTDKDPTVEFRVCDCEKCGGKSTDYCLKHALEH